MDTAPPVRTFIGHPGQKVNAFGQGLVPPFTSIPRLRHRQQAAVRAENRAMQEGNQVGPMGGQVPGHVQPGQGKDVSPFDRIRKVRPDGSEYWEGRELLTGERGLGYQEWRNAEKAIRKAIKACENLGCDPSDHIVEVNKMVQVGSGAQREVLDYELDRFLCYLVAMNSDPEKPQVAAAQGYFAIQTRFAEKVQANPHQLAVLASLAGTLERLAARMDAIENRRLLAPVGGPDFAVKERLNQLLAIHNLHKVKEAWKDKVMRYLMGKCNILNIPIYQTTVGGVIVMPMQYQPWAESVMMWFIREYIEMFHTPLFDEPTNP